MYNENLEGLTEESKDILADAVRDLYQQWFRNYVGI
jgi:hypothetical protein